MHKAKVIAICSLILATGCAAPQSNVANPLQSIESHVIGGEGISIRKLNTGVDSNDKEYATFSYELRPSNTTHTEIGIRSLWKETAEESWGLSSDYVSLSIDLSSKTFTVTKTQDFSHVIIVRLYDVLDDNVKSDVEIHLARKFLGWIEDAEDHEPGKTAEVYLDGSIWPGMQDFESKVKSWYTHGFSSVYTDDIDGGVTVSNASIEKVDLRYYWPPSPPSYQSGAADFDSSLEGRIIDAIDQDFRAAFPLATVFGGNGPTSQSISSVIGNNASKLSASDLQQWHSYDDGMVIDVKLAFDATIAQSTKSGLSMWYSFYVPYEFYSSQTEISLNSIATETQSYSF